MKCKIDQEGMSNGKWRILEYSPSGYTIVRCPFDSMGEALQNANDLAKFYGEKLEVIE